MSRRSKRRLKPRRAVDLPSAPTESVCTVEYVDGALNRTSVIEAASPPRDAKATTSLPGLSWKNFLRDLKAGDIEQVSLITDGDSVSHAINSIDSADTSSRPKSAEPKSRREERFAAQFWESLKASGYPRSMRRFVSLPTSTPTRSLRSCQQIVVCATRSNSRPARSTA
ncbi:hypothetical protein PF010_g7189 [Phytophthora fragariae]|uniref:Uncharacterized protein n=1 Tax=Phytophthora fragariae TaxID=53985 RepID=A0A6A4F1W1_9STRA|nr:hypothetical protein PF003_g5742 [Phytophthora fragariae]KAE8950427.1 hypothetical protein PF009_g6 [Phytophthora fragariae]KAE9121227.1 hypothetical protein PF010_g7189 [Phytophthora fragariae]KAE9141607.1 hypothetical protein PF007_g127 [Phytophthora fragariae]KAE9156047.1 hypothetical protein PF006_g6 [Phytophthora fragariae]